MNLPLLRTLGATFGLVVFAATTVSGAVLAESTATGGVASIFWGQSFTVVGGGSFTNLVANFFTDSPAASPLAAGTGFLLSAAYTGAPGSLSSSTPGYLGQAVGAGGFYSFGSSVTLLSGTQYFLFSNTMMAASGDVGSPYAGGSAYGGSGQFPTFSPSPDQDLAFRISGTAASSTPDGGSTLALLGLALGAVAVVRRKRS